jgi:hypothetical protein
MVSTRWLASFARCCVLIRFSINPINVCTASSCAALEAPTSRPVRFVYGAPGF